MTGTQKSAAGAKRTSGAWTIVRVLLLVFVLGGIFGFFYEELFYRIDLGHFIKRGTTLGPWIPIYGFGALLITASTHRLRKRPWLVFAVGGGVCGALEFTAGYLLYHVGNVRLWDYNAEIWNWGNIGGYVCFRSVLVFAGASLLLIYLVVPFIRFLERKLSGPLFSAVSLTLGGLFLADILLSSVLPLH